MAVIKAPVSREELAQARRIYLYGNGGTGKVLIGILGGLGVSNIGGFIVSGSRSTPQPPVLMYGTWTLPDYVENIYQTGDLVLVASTFVNEILKELLPYPFIDVASALPLASLYGAADGIAIRELMENCLPERLDTVLDIGASIGIYSTYFATKSQHTVAFEPVSDIQSIFDFNCAERNNITLEKMALGDVCSDSVTMTVPHFEGGRTTDYFAMQSTLTPEILPHELYEHLGQTPGERKVQMTTLDTWHEETRLPPPQFIKIDVEGFEMQVLKGAKNLIEKHRPAFYIETLYNADEIVQFMHQFSYQPIMKISRHQGFHPGSEKWSLSEVANAVSAYPHDIAFLPL